LARNSSGTLISVSCWLSEPWLLLQRLDVA
jgi:hypothetical protein